jgi:2,4-dienoyl-CoA reductase-like NADH-dependent reductase (Old Yellow Enzyme family)
MDAPVTTDALAPLFQPFAHPKLELKNRIAMAPMTRSFSPGGVPGGNVAAYYRRRAEAEVSLIITEGTTVNDPVSANDPNVPHFYGEEALAGWRRIVDEVHAAGGKIAPQLWHVGTMRRQEKGPNPELPSSSASGLFKPGKKVAEPMTLDQIEALVAAFAEGARDAKRLGFDAVEIHGAHGYVIDQFFWEGTNERTDSFGGDLVRRTRLAAEIVKAVRAEVGPDFPILLRFSQWKQQDYGAKLAQTPQELEQFLAPLVEAGVDIFHASTRRFWEPEFEDSNLNLAGWTKKITGLPTMTVGSVGLSQEFVATFAGEDASVAAERIEELAARLGAGEFDLVAVGRALIVDPDWVIKLREGRIDEFTPYTKDALKELV